MSKFAVIKFRNEQYLVEEGKNYEINRYEAKPGDKIKFSEVLLKVDGDKVEIGQPTIKDAVVEAEIIKDLRGEKVIKMTYKAKSRERKKVGHRQDLTEVKITKIL